MEQSFHHHENDDSTIEDDDIQSVNVVGFKLRFKAILLLTVQITLSILIVSIALTLIALPLLYVIGVFSTVSFP